MNLADLKVSLAPYTKAVVAVISATIVALTTIGGVVADGELDVDDALIIATAVGGAVEVYRRPNAARKAESNG